MEIGEAEGMISDHSDGLDIKAGRGVPAHVTVLYWSVPRLTSTTTCSAARQPPLAGAFAEVVPGLTVRHGHALSVIRPDESDVQSKLPLGGQARTLTLPTEAGARCAHTAVFALRGTEPPLAKSS